MTKKTQHWKLRQDGLYVGLLEVYHIPGGALVRHFGCSTRHEVKHTELARMLKGAEMVDWPPKD